MLAFLPLHGYTGRHRRGVQLEPEGSVDGGSYVLSAAEEIAPRWNCIGTFIDAGANNGDTLRSWYTDESCAIAPHQLRGKPCAWQWPWWLQLKERQKYCAKAYEPNSRLSHPLHHAAFILRHQLGVHIEVFNGTAFGEADGTAVFGIDQTSSNAEGSSLMLHKRTKTLAGGVGTGPEVGENRMTVRTVDALRCFARRRRGPLRSRSTWRCASLRGSLLNRFDAAPLSVLPSPPQGYEGRLMRNLLLSGVMCRRVQNLWVEWHTAKGQVRHPPAPAMPAPARSPPLYARHLNSWTSGI